MLKPTSDRLDYGSLLAPPVGFEVVSAIGTTYSLDLDALIGICISLGLSESTESALMNNPVYLLEALRRTADKVVLFCEAGQIHVPNTNNSLYILLEKMIFEVAVQKQPKLPPVLPSFHPKFWLIKYKDAIGTFRYRSIILSRNLTFDRSWDVSVCLEGTTQVRVDKRSLPVRDFLNYLNGFLQGSEENTKTKRKLINNLAREIVNVGFKADDRMFTDFDFIPVGVKDENGEKYSMNDYPIFADTFHEVLIMSPFLSANIISEFNKKNKNIENPQCTLITRRESLTKLTTTQCDKFKIYTMKDTIVDGESMLSDESSDLRKQDIHAKLYLWRKYSESELYLGSFNASNSAMNGNIEMMLRLCSKRSYLNTEILTKDFFSGEPDNKDNPFELTSLPDNIEPVDDKRNVLQKQIKELCRSKHHASVQENDGKYDINITFSKLRDMEGLSIAPMLSNKSGKVAELVVIEGLDLLQVSNFYRVTAESEGIQVSRVIKIATDNMPENREGAVVTSIVKDKQCFIQYIAFLLGENYLLSLIEAATSMQYGYFGSSNSMQMPALYEKMLKAAASSPDRFSEIDYLMKMITDTGIIPEGFTELYNTCKKVVGLHD